MDHLLLISGDAPTCHVCDSDLSRGVCLRCEQRRSIGLVQARCTSCRALFTYDEDYAPQAMCDPCAGDYMRATIRATRMLRPLRAA